MAGPQHKVTKMASGITPGAYLLWQKNTVPAPKTLFCRKDYGTSGSDILVLRNDWQQQVGRMLTVAVDFVECWFAVAYVPHHIICFGVGRNIDA